MTPEALSAADFDFGGSLGSEGIYRKRDNIESGAIIMRALQDFCR